MNEDIDITGNIKTIEWIKTELLESVASVYRILLRGSKASQDIIVDCLAGIIILTYLLGERLGIGFSAVDLKIQNKLKVGILEGDEIEKSHGDLSKLLKYVKVRKLD